MRGCRALFGLALVAIVQLVAGETKFPEENDVIVLSDENFDAAITVSAFGCSVVSFESLCDPKRPTAGDVADVSV